MARNPKARGQRNPPSWKIWCWRRSLPESSKRSSRMPPLANASSEGNNHSRKSYSGPSISSKSAVKRMVTVSTPTSVVLSFCTEPDVAVECLSPQHHGTRAPAGTGCQWLPQCGADERNLVLPVEELACVAGGRQICGGIRRQRYLRGRSLGANAYQAGKTS